MDDESVESNVKKHEFSLKKIMKNWCRFFNKKARVSSPLNPTINAGDVWGLSSFLKKVSQEFTGLSYHETFNHTTLGSADNVIEYDTVHYFENHEHSPDLYSKAFVVTVEYLQDEIDYIHDFMFEQNQTNWRSAVQSGLDIAQSVSIQNLCNSTICDSINLESCKALTMYHFDTTDVGDFLDSTLPRVTFEAVCEETGFFDCSNDTANVHDCVNGSPRCGISSDFFECKCASGWEGDNCSTEVNNKYTGLIIGTVIGGSAVCIVVLVLVYLYSRCYSRCHVMKGKNKP